MDSRLDSLFRTNFQPAQKSDTRQEIRREEPQDDRPKKDRQKKSDQPAGDDDVTTLSIVALHEFLKNLLKQSGESFFSTAGETLLSQEPGEHTDIPANPASAHAAHAYQVAARALPGQSIDFSDHRPTQPASTTPAIALSTDDLRTIHKLIEDVEALGKRGIAVIALREADSFLHSLVKGVEEASG